MWLLDCFSVSVPLSRDVVFPLGDQIITLQSSCRNPSARIQ